VEPIDDDTEPVLPPGVGSDRRRARRRDLMLPASIDTTRRAHRFGMTRNLSRTGALLVTPARFEIGERARLSFRAGDDPRTVPLDVDARIVRLEVNAEDPLGLFRYLMAVRFDTPLPSGIMLQSR
jgi:hypothetical protein